MRIGFLFACLGLLMIAGCESPSSRPDLAVLAQQVKDTELRFAKTMADRDHAAFSAFLSEEAIFFSETRVLRGKQQVAEGWRGLFEASEAPFSWEPETVEVLESGTLALSSGPVRDAQGRVFATFNSIWRLEEPGTWRVIFDKGNEVCE